MASILTNALLNLAYRDILVPGVLSQSPKSHGQCISEEVQLQLITSLYLLNLTFTNLLKPRSNSSRTLFRNVFHLIFENDCETKAMETAEKGEGVTDTNFNSAGSKET